MKNSPGRCPRVSPLVWCVVFLLSMNQAEAVCPPREPSRGPGEEPFRYALTLAESFSHAQSALSVVTPAESSGRNLGSDRELSQLVNRLRSASEEYSCAAELVAPYAESSEEGIALSAQAVAFTYGQLMQLDDRKTELIQAAVEGRLTRENLAERLDRGRAQTEETWRLLISATVMGTVALAVPPARQEDPLSRLRISDQQRKTLAERLEQDFGPMLREEAARGESALVAAARLLHGFVSNPDLESSDAR